MTPEGRALLEKLRAELEADEQRRTGADLIEALQASPRRDIDIEPERTKPPQNVTLLTACPDAAAPLEIARMFTVPVAAVRKVLAFALTAELLDLLNGRLAGRWTGKDAYRFDKLGRQLAEIDRALIVATGRRAVVWLAAGVGADPCRLLR